jgi:DNA anti-recombination protein RmuC
MADDRNAPLTKGDLLEALGVVVTQIRQEIKHEIGQVRYEIKQEIAELRTEMKREIAQLRAEMSEQISRLRTEMSEQIAQLRAEMSEQISQLRTEMSEQIAQLRAEAQHQYEDLIEKIRDSQTETLKAFYSYAQTTDIKLKDGAAADASLRERVAIIESRLLEVERRLLMPPQP